MTVDFAQAVGLTLHELATNAIKHGALSVPHGRLSISWDVDQARLADGFKLDWREHDGPSVTVPTRRAFEHVVMKRMVEEAVQEIVELNFAQGGLQWSLTAPPTVCLCSHRIANLLTAAPAGQ